MDDESPESKRWVKKMVAMYLPAVRNKPEYKADFTLLEYVLD